MTIAQGIGDAQWNRQGLAASLSQTVVAAEDGHDHDPQTVQGTNGPDEIVTGGGPQIIFGLNGADVIHAGGGPDEVHAGNGADQVFGQGGPDSIFGGNGDDYLDGGPGPDVIEGGNGDDVLIGGIAADTLTGGRGSDVFVYRAANEAPAHGEGDDESHDGAGSGEDHAAGQETITDFTPGTDAIDFSAIDNLQGYGDGPAAYGIWAVQQGEDTMLYLDTNGSVEGDPPAEMSILLSGVDAATLSEGDFIL